MLSFKQLSCFIFLSSLVSIRACGFPKDIESTKIVLRVYQVIPGRQLQNRFQKSQLVEIERPEECWEFDAFETTASYIILKRQYGRTARVYYWHGKESSLENRQTAVDCAVRLVWQIHGTISGTPLVRVIQGEEKKYQNDFWVDFNFGENTQSSEIPIKLYKVKGYPTAHVMQVPANWQELNMDDCFVLQRNYILYSLCGPTANESEIKKSYDLRRQIAHLNDANQEIKLIEWIMTWEELKGVLGGKIHDFIKPMDEITDSDFTQTRYTQEYISKLKYIRGVEENVSENILNLKYLQYQQQAVFLFQETATKNTYVFTSMGSKSKDIIAALQKVETMFINDEDDGWDKVKQPINSPLNRYDYNPDLLDFKLLFPDGVQEIIS